MSRHRFLIESAQCENGSVLDSHFWASKGEAVFKDKIGVMFRQIIEPARSVPPVQPAEHESPQPLRVAESVPIAPVVQEERPKLVPETEEMKGQQISSIYQSAMVSEPVIGARGKMETTAEVRRPATALEKGEDFEEKYNKLYNEYVR